jgi:hypothetical protein
LLGEDELTIIAKNLWQPARTSNDYFKAFQETKRINPEARTDAKIYRAISGGKYQVSVGPKP